MKYFLIYSILCFSQLFSQQISGVLQDSKTKLPIPFAAVVVQDFGLKTISDVNGAFSFTLSPAEYVFEISAVGYKNVTIKRNLTLDSIFYLNETHSEIEEVSVVGHYSVLQHENTSHVTQLKMADLNAIPTLNIGQVLEQLPGVYNGNTGAGISKPVIRGLQGARVVSLMNGVRIENQQWAGDHGLGITELGVEKVELLKGPSSLLYGADALGGVIYFVDESFAPKGTTKVTLSSLFDANALNTVNQFFVKSNAGNIKISGGIRYANAADYRLPTGDFVKLSRNSDFGGKLNIGWNKKKRVNVIRLNVSRSSAGIPGHTHDSLPLLASFLSKTQTREVLLPNQFNTLGLLSLQNTWFLNRSTIKVLSAASINDIQEFEGKTTFPNIQLSSFNFQNKTELEHHVNEKWMMIFGVAQLYSVTQNGSAAAERFIPNYSQYDLGAYHLQMLHWRRFVFQLGIRGDLRTLHPRGQEDKQFNAFNFSSGLVWNKKSQHLHINMNSGVRMPNLIELFADGGHSSAQRFEIGNVALKPESGIQLDVSYEIESEHIHWIINPFFAKYSNFIQASIQDSVVDGFQVFKYEQFTAADMFGGEVGLHYHPHFAHWLHYESSLAYVRGYYSNGPSMEVIPQPRISNSLKGNFNLKNKKWELDLVVQSIFNLRQDRVGLNESQSEGFHVLNSSINLNYQRQKTNYQLQVGARNLFDEMYIDHISRLKNIGLAAPGRSIFVKFLIQYNYEK